MLAKKSFIKTEFFSMHLCTRQGGSKANARVSVCMLVLLLFLHSKNNNKYAVKIKDFKSMVSRRVTIMREAHAWF